VSAVRVVRPFHSVNRGIALWALALSLGTVLAGRSAQAETRAALVIGESAYAHGGRLENPANDAAIVAQSLRQDGFTVTLQTDLGRTELEGALKGFTRASAGADIALVYFAGHGIEKAGTNYLIPIDATLAADSDVDFEAVPLDLVMHAVSGATRLKVVILDACRNNPFRDAMKRSAGTRGIGQGLAKPPNPEEGDMLVAYAAEAGSTAEDGAGADSPFATALAHHLADPAVDIRIMFGRVRDDVRAATGMRQEPAVYESLGGEQFFMTPATVAEAKASAPRGAVAQRPPAPPDQKTMDLTYWQSVQASNDPAQLKDYLDQYPNGAFATLAKAKIAALQTAQAQPGPRRLARAQMVGDQAAPGSAGPGPSPPAAAQPDQASMGRTDRGAGMGGGMGGPRAGRFDGPWRVSQTCPNPQDPTHPFAPMGFTVHVHAGRVHGSRGVADQPGWLALDGVIEPDGAATLAAHGVMRGGPNGPPAGTPFGNVVTARFTEAGGTGQWVAKRACQFTFTRPLGPEAAAGPEPPSP
jgi:hypothetical protein